MKSRQGVPHTRHQSQYYVWPVSVSFNVQSSWKGVTTTTTAIFTGNGGDCGYPFKVGNQYLVYAHNFYSDLATGICSRTIPASAAAIVTLGVRILLTTT